MSGLDVKQLAAGTQFTCFTSTKKKSTNADAEARSLLGDNHSTVLTSTQFACFTSAKVQILTAEEQETITQQC